MSGIAIVNYGMGNFHSVARALRAAAPNAEVRICDTAADIDAADRVVFPGQGAMRDCMRTLNESGLREAVERAARTKPLLGVCVGEQMLFSRSDEGNTACLDIFPGTVQRFAGPAFSKILTPAEGDAVQAQADAATRSAFDAEGAEAAGSDAAALQADLLTPNELLKIPHMGWNRVRQTRDHALWAGIPDQTHFYFVHSYYVATEDPTLVVGQTEYGFDFTCAVARDNIFAVQFHPEKSADHGLRLYRNFVDWQP